MRRYTPYEQISAFWDKVEFTESCWLWTGGTTAGYGKFQVYRNPVLAHRYAYEFCVGTILDGLELDHLCRNTLCVRPDHLEQVTHQVNMSRGNSGINRKEQTRCVNDHLFSKRLDPRGHRICRTCTTIRSRQHRMRKKVA